MKRIHALLAVPAIAAAIGLALSGSPADAQWICYNSYVTMSGSCPDSCGRGDECPCTTCINQS